MNKELSEYCCWLHINPKTLKWICTCNKATKGIKVDKKKCDDCLMRNKNSHTVKNYKLL